MAQRLLAYAGCIMPGLLYEDRCPLLSAADTNHNAKSTRSLTRDERVDASGSGPLPPGATAAALALQIFILGDSTISLDWAWVRVLSQCSNVVSSLARTACILQLTQVKPPCIPHLSPWQQEKKSTTLYILLKSHFKSHLCFRITCWYITLPKYHK